MKKMNLILALLVSASASGHLQAQWSEVDTLITKSQGVVDILDEGYERIAGASALVGTSIVGDGMMTANLNGDQTLMTSSALGDYNNAMTSVSNATYSVSVQDYLDGQYTATQAEFDAAVDTYVAAASVFAKAVMVNNLASAASASENIQDARALQDYISDNNLGITGIMQSDYNNSIDEVEDAVQLYSAVAILKDDTTTVASLQTDADNASRDYMYADDAVYDDQAETLEWGYTGPSAETQYNITTSVDMSAYVTNSISALETAASTDDFYNDGPTQNACFFATSAQQSDPLDACYNGS